MKPEELRVLIITNAYPDPSRSNFASQFVADQVEFLSRHVAEVTVICPVPILPIRPFRRSYTTDNIRIIFKYYYPAYGRHIRRGDWLEHISSLYVRLTKKIVRSKRVNFDVIHGHFSVPSGLASVILKDELHKPAIITLHENHEWFLELNKESDPSYVRAWKGADLVLRVNEDDMALIDKFNENVEYLPNGFNSHNYYMDNSIIREKETIFSMGGLIERKGFQDLIYSVSEIRKQLPNIKCYIAGQDGGYEIELLKMISDLDLKNVVTLMGPVSADIAREMMNKCSVFCLPSFSESFGVVQIEAMACGAPVVALFNGASEKLIEEGCGLVVERSLLQRALIEALTNVQWDNQQIIERVKKYDMDVISLSIIDKYIHLIQKYSKSS